MQKVPMSKRLRYAFDNTMSKGTGALIAWLGLASALLIGLAALIIVIAKIPPAPGEEPVSFWEAFWLGLMRTLDSGTMGGDEGTGFRLVGLGVTLAGVFIISILIGLLTSGIESKLDDLRKGRSFVVETNHTVILGWGPQVYSIISELVLANENQRDACVVILAPKDKVEMEDEIRDKVGDLKTTRIVCRTGNPIDLADLEIVNPHASKAIIIPAPDMDDPDTNVIKSILAITNNPNRRPVEQPYHIVAEIRNRRNFEVARMVGKDEVELVLADDLISRITVQTSLQSGLSVVYTDLLDFGGDEIYFSTQPALVGKTFGEAVHLFEDSALIGLRYAPGKLALNPPMDQRIEADHQLIMITEDDDRIRVSGSSDFGINAEVIRDPDFKTMIPVRVLILGWNRRAPSVLQELDNYLFKGSKIVLVAESDDAAEVIERQNAGLKQAQVEFIAGDITDRAVLNEINAPAFQHVILLSYSDDMDPQQADARTLVTLLHLRDISDKKRAGYSIATEMLDIQNRDLAAVTRSDDFIVSNKLVSLMLTQISENKELSLVFEDLFDPEGSEMYLKPIGDYIAPGRAVNFHTIVEAARRKGHVAVGYRLQGSAASAAQAYGVHLNPKKSEQVKFEEGDRVIVLADN